MWNTGGVWPPAFLLRRHVRAFQENRYLPAGPSFQSPICPGAPARWTERSKGEKHHSTGGRMHASVAMTPPFNRACVKEVLKESRTNSLKRTIISVQRSCVGTQTSIHGCCALPACTGAEQHVALLLLSEEEVVISQRPRFSMSIFTPARCCLASLITNGNHWDTSVVFMTTYLNFSILLSCCGPELTPTLSFLGLTRPNFKVLQGPKKLLMSILVDPWFTLTPAIQ